jgi:hypothetical protein
MPTEVQDKEQELRSEALTLYDRASTIVVTNQSQYDDAAEILRTVKAMRKRWLDYWNPLRDGAYKSYKAILAKISEGDDPLEKAEVSLKRAILKFDDEQRRIQEELQREAQRKAEEEEEARRAQAAFEAEEAGASAEEVESIVAAPNLAVAPPVQPTYQKAAGISRRDNWCIQVTDLKALLKHIGTGKLKLSAEDSRELAEFLQSLLKPRAVSDKETLNIPGCKAVNVPVLAGRSR